MGSGKFHAPVLDAIQDQEAREPHRLYFCRSTQQRDVEEETEHHRRAFREAIGTVNSHLVIGEAEMNVLGRLELSLAIQVFSKQTTQCARNFKSNLVLLPPTEN